MRRRRARPIRVRNLIEPHYVSETLTVQKIIPSLGFLVSFSPSRSHCLCHLRVPSGDFGEETLSISRDRTFATSFYPMHLSTTAWRLEQVGELNWILVPLTVKEKWKLTLVAIVRAAGPSCVHWCCALKKRPMMAYVILFVFLCGSF